MRAWCALALVLLLPAGCSRSSGRVAPARPSTAAGRNTIQVVFTNGSEKDDLPH